MTFKSRIEKARVGVQAWLRLSYAAAGIACVGIGALGVVVPGLPTVIFLLAAGWLFSKSCPHLEQRLIRHRFFAPFHEYLDGTQPIPWRAKAISIAGMWISIAISCAAIGLRHRGSWLLVVIPLAGVVGTVFILRFRSMGTIRTCLDGAGRTPIRLENDKPERQTDSKSG